MKSIKARLQLSVCGLVVLLVVLSVIYFPWQQRNQMLEAFARELRDSADTLALVIEVGLRNGDFDSVRRAFDHAKSDSALVALIVVEADGRVLAALPSSAAETLAAAPPVGLERSRAEMRYTAAIEADEHGNRRLVVVKSLAGVNARVMRVVYEALTLGGLMLLLAFAIAHVIASSHARPLEELSRATRAVAEGRLSTQVEMAGTDEITSLGKSFNRMARGLARLVDHMRESSRAVRAVSRDLIGEASQLVSAVARQEEAIEGTGTAVSRMTHSTGTVVEDVSRLAGSARETSGAIREMEFSIGQVDAHMDGLSEALDGAASGAGQMVASMNEVVLAMDQLRRGTELAADQLSQLTASVGSVESNARRCGDLSTGASSEAEAGEVAVEDTASIIREVRDGFDRIRTSVHTLADRSVEVGEILGVIEEVAEQTNLLSLNASIIAAQAGEHGRGFAVVAGEIKLLAGRTAEATREIATLIDQVGRETATAVEVVEAGGLTVDRGVARSAEASRLLSSIKQKADTTARCVGEIVDLTGRQAADIRRLEQAMRDVEERVETSSSATRRHDELGTTLSGTLDQIRDLGMMVKSSTAEQSEQSRSITKAAEEVTASFERILEAAGDQARQSQRIHAALEVFREVAQEISRRSQDFQGALVERSRELEEAIDRFET